MRARTRGPAWMVPLALAVLAGKAPAAPLIDPFLERFRVGAYQDAAAMRLVEGWPADLFLPCRVDSLWLAAAETVLARAGDPAGPLAAPLVEAALGGDPRRSAWLAGRRTRLAALLVPGRIDSLEGSGRGWLAKELLAESAIISYEHGIYGIGAIEAERLLAQAALLGLSPEERFVWSLRARRLRELSHRAPALPDPEPWPEMLELAGADASAAWALWSARQRSLGRDLLPAGCGSDRLARFLVRLPRGGLAPGDLAAAGFGGEALAALGAACLERGPLLAAHFAAHPAPPADPRYQDAWVRGRMRAAAWSPATAESVADLAGLLPAQRGRLLRRASEERLLGDDWQGGLNDLERALAAAAADEAARRPVADWAGQALALAHVRDRPSEAGRIRSLVSLYLPGDELAAWELAVAPVRARLATAPPDSGPADAGDAAARAVRKVRMGRAAPLQAPATAPSWPEPADAWEAWTAWGLALARDGRASLADARAAEYGDALAAAAAAATPAARERLALAALGRFLHGHPSRGPALDWMLAHAVRRTAGPGTAAPSLPSPLFAAEGRGWPDRHVLLGLALAADDPHTVLATARDLPAAGLPFARRAPFLYPVASDPRLREEMLATGVDPALLLAVARNESLFDPGARSGAGALGLLQIMPFHYRERGAPGGDPLWRRPAESLRAGARLLRENARAFDDDPYRALAAYNAGGEAVRRWVRQLGGRADPDLFLLWIGYPETRAYVEKVLIDREIYSWMVRGQPVGAP